MRNHKSESSTWSSSFMLPSVEEHLNQNRSNFVHWEDAFTLIVFGFHLLFEVLEEKISDDDKEQNG